MALTENVKSRSVNVTTGEVVTEYFDQVEYDALVAARAAKELPNARARRTSEVKSEAAALVNTLIPDYPFRAIRYIGQMIKLLDGAKGRGYDASEKAKRDSFDALFAATEAVRMREEAAIAAIEAAVTVAEVEAVVL